MSETLPKCPKCDGTMQEGFIAPFVGGSAHMLPRWVVGKPVRSVWTGLKTSDKAQYDVRTYRCKRCGFLESYAK